MQLAIIKLNDHSIQLTADKEIGLVKALVFSPLTNSKLHKSAAKELLKHTPDFIRKCKLTSWAAVLNTWIPLISSDVRINSSKQKTNVHVTLPLILVKQFLLPDSSQKTLLFSWEKGWPCVKAWLEDSWHIIQCSINGHGVWH